MDAGSDANMREEQLLIIGGDQRLAVELAKESEPGTRHITYLSGSDWQGATWQARRKVARTAAVIVMDNTMPGGAAELEECVRMVKLSVRPMRLLVILPKYDTGQVLHLLKSGADGFLAGDYDAYDVIEELARPPLDREALFPDPARWLEVLTRVAQEMDIRLDTGLQLRKMLRIFVSQLMVEKASILLLDGKQMRLAAAVGYPPTFRVDSPIVVTQGSITESVIRHRRPRLVVGEDKASRSLSGAVTSSVCAPIIAEGILLGTVNFSSSADGRQLGQADLSTTEVFAALLAMAITNQQLAEKNVEQERLAAIGATMSNVSHCLKNLLTIFKGSTMILDRGVSRNDPAELKVGTELINKGVQRIESLVMDLLDLSKKREPSLEPTNVLELVEDVERQHRAAPHRKDHQFTASCTVAGNRLLDGYRLQRAMLNLMGNSVDAITEHGRVSLRVFEEGDWLVFEVADDGPGVPEEKLASIFQPFYSTKGSMGTGLGLAMVMKFCAECGGSVTADHEGELNGLRVIMRLPNHPAE